MIGLLTNLKEEKAKPEEQGEAYKGPEELWD